jgi:hypothetical protein
VTKAEPRFHPIELRGLPIALLLILATTAIPVELRAPQAWRFTPDPGDVIANILLFMPLGMAIWRCGQRRALAAGLLISLAVEVLQEFSFGRYPSVYDVACNGAGAGIGAALVAMVPRIQKIPLRLGRSAVALAAAGITVWLGIWTFPATPPSLRQWSSDMPLMLGNERTGDRPWAGRIESLEFYARRYAPRDLHGGQAAPPPLIHVKGPFELTGNRAVTLPTEEARRLVTAVGESSALTVVVHFSVQNLEQDGPARIVSFSTDPFHRNFDIGQMRDRIRLRLRTPVSGPNGNVFYAESGPVLVSDRLIELVASYDGAVARLHIDGHAVARLNLDAKGRIWPDFFEEYAPAAWALLGVLVCIVLFGLSRRRSRIASLVAAASAGVMTLLLPWLSKLLAENSPRVSFATTLSAIFGALLFAAAIKAGSDLRTEDAAPRRNVSHVV